MKYAINEPDADEKKTFERLDKNSFYILYFISIFSVHESQLRGFICGLFGLRAKNNIPIAYLLVAASAPRQVVWLTLFSPPWSCEKIFLSSPSKNKENHCADVSIELFARANETNVGQLRNYKKMSFLHQPSARSSQGKNEELEKQCQWQIIFAWVSFASDGEIML